MYSVPFTLNQVFTNTYMILSFQFCSRHYIRNTLIYYIAFYSRNLANASDNILLVVCNLLCITSFKHNQRQHLPIGFKLYAFSPFYVCIMHYNLCALYAFNLTHNTMKDNHNLHLHLVTGILLYCYSPMHLIFYVYYA